MIEPGNSSVYTKNDEQNSQEAKLASLNGLSIEVLAGTQQEKQGDLVIVLQGYFHTKQSVKEWTQHIYDTSNFPATYACITYDYWNKSFDLTGAELYDLLTSYYPNPSTDYNRIIVIAYSMGGLVARKFLSLGFPYNKLITFCTPHEGIFNHVADWGGTGAKSMHKDSPYVKVMNKNPQDIANRYKHFYIAYQYYSEKDRKTHPDDTILWSHSGTGAFLGDHHYWEIYTWPYDIAGVLWPTEPYAPHKLPGIKKYYDATSKPVITYLKGL